MSDHQAKKRKLVLWLILSLVGIIIIWGLSLQFTWPDEQDGESFAWPEWNPSENSIKAELDVLMSKINKEEVEEEVKEVNEREIISNPGQLSEEEIKQIEEDIFPKEKNAKE